MRLIIICVLALSCWTYAAYSFAKKLGSFISKSDVDEDKYNHEGGE